MHGAGDKRENTVQASAGGIQILRQKPELYNQNSKLQLHHRIALHHFSACYDPAESAFIGQQ